MVLNCIKIKMIRRISSLSKDIEQNKSDNAMNNIALSGKTL